MKSFIVLAVFLLAAVAMAAEAPKPAEKDLKGSETAYLAYAHPYAAYAHHPYAALPYAAYAHHPLAYHPIHAAAPIHAPALYLRR